MPIIPYAHLKENPDKQDEMSNAATQNQQAAVQNGYMAPDNSLERVIPPRAEGYRPAVIRESRIKERPYKSAGKDSLSIKIELDLEVEVSWF